MSRVTIAEWYRRVNAAYPTDLPIPTQAQALNGARRLYRFATGRTFPAASVRLTSGRNFTWVYDGVLRVNPNRQRGDGVSGWRALVHDISHYAHRVNNPGERPHGATHARLEIACIKEVIKRGWLVERAPVVRVSEAPSDAELNSAVLAQIDARIKRWTTKAKRAATALRKLNRQRKHYARKGGVRGGGLRVG